MKLTCGDAAAARACRAADRVPVGDAVGLVTYRDLCEARRLLKAGRFVDLRLVAIPPPGVAGFWATDSGRLAAAVESSGRSQTQRWAVVRMSKVPDVAGCSFTARNLRVILAFCVVRRVVDALQIADPHAGLHEVARRVVRRRKAA